ncbi:MAG: DUF859 family phage minor structural protein [Christensenellaceae bacterium]
MAIINGSFTSGTFAQYYSFYIEYFVSQNVTNNTSTVTVNTYIRKDKATQTAYGNNKTAYQSVNGVNRSAGYSYDFRNSTLKLIQSEVYTVAHNADGTKQIYIGASTNGGTTLLGAASAGATVTLPTIPRASGVSVSSSVTAGSNLGVTISAASSAFRHDVYITFAGRALNHSLSAGVTSASVPIPLEWINGIPNATSGTMTVYLNTWSGDTWIGQKVTSSTLLVGSSIVPTLSGAITPQNQLGGYYVQGKSGVAVALTGAGSYSSTIKSYSGKVGYASYAGQNFSSTLTDYGSVRISGMVTDSRGRTSSWYKDIYVYPYSPPAVETLEVVRCDSNGTANSVGDYLKARLKARTQVIGSPNVNTRLFRVTFEPKGGSAVVKTLSNANATIDAWTDPVYVGQLVTCKVTGYVADWYGSSTHTTEVPTAERILNVKSNGHGMGIGGVAENDGLTVYWDANFHKKPTVNGSDISVESKGVWTPTFKRNSNGITLPTVGNRGEYFRVGKLVFFTFKLQAGTFASPVGSYVFVTGLPFPPDLEVIPDAMPLGMYWYRMGVNFSMLYGNMVSSGDFIIRGTQAAANNSFTNVAETHLVWSDSEGTLLMGSGVYVAAE